MQDQRVILGAALGFKDLGNRQGVQTIGTQSVHSFRGNRHQATFFDNFRCDSGGIYIESGKK